VQILSVEIPNPVWVGEKDTGGAVNGRHVVAGILKKLDKDCLQAHTYMHTDM